ncbi:MAG TPA: hypothetical protein GXX28_02135 [Firmicutes bacterium]|nr:hypothetical protein [Bacillota bacterium]
MVPWWLIPVAGSVAVLLFGALVAGARDDDRRRLWDLQVAVQQAFVALLEGRTQDAADVLHRAMARE